ncbi:MAG: hypothetical protein K5657_03830 [Desulfovibrio sp.]|nr:hypothetical protein [Desulfovibrio sp.]
MKQQTDSAWSLWQNRRRRQSLVGKISAFFFLCAALALLDGLQTLVRTDASEIWLIAGNSEGVSGACPFQNPVQSDIEATFMPKDAPVSFELEGFFSGYLIGNGMWRGTVSASSNATTQDCSLTVSFRGMTEGQRFRLRLFASPEDREHASPSFILRFFGLEPFIAAAFLAGTAFLFGFVSFLLGRANLSLLQDLGHAEVFRTASVEPEEVRLWCSANGRTDLRPGQILSVLNGSGESLCEGVVKHVEKNVLCLSVPVGIPVHPGCLVDLSDRGK